MKIVNFQKRITKIKTFLEIIENHENHKISHEIYETHEHHWISYENQQNLENIKISIRESWKPWKSQNPLENH